jgi:Fe-S-cluster containining protein
MKRLSRKEKMMNLIDHGKSGMGTEEFGADLPMTPEENFVRAVYSSVDEAVACVLDRLRSEDGIVPSCKLGCCHCCRYHIVMNIAEARTLAQYVKREFSAEQRKALRMRTKRWHEWDDSLRGGRPSVGTARQTDPSPYDPCCPLLVNGTCSAYGVRPIVCRTHFVSSPPLSCHAANDPESAEESPLVIEVAIAVTNRFSMAIKDHIEKAGLDYSRSMTLLPHGLASEMGWDFAVSP